MKKLILALCLVGAFAPLFTNAQTGTPCHLLTSSQSVPNGFGAAYNLFSTAKPIFDSWGR